jgi:hypothetical protein
MDGVDEEKEKELEKTHFESRIPNVSKGNEITEKDQRKDFIKKTEFENCSVSKTTMLTKKRGKTRYKSENPESLQE